MCVVVVASHSDVDVGRSLGGGHALSNMKGLRKPFHSQSAQNNIELVTHPSLVEHETSSTRICQFPAT